MTEKKPKLSDEVVAAAVVEAVEDLLSEATFAHNYRTDPGFRAALDQLRWSVDATFEPERPTVDGVSCLSADELPEEIDEDDTPVRTVAVIRADLPAQWAESAKRIVIDGVEHYLVEGVEIQEGDEETVDGIALGIGDVPERMARYAAARGKTVDEVLADPSIAKMPGGSFIEAEDRVRRQRIRIDAVRRQYPEITDESAIALHQKAVAAQSAERVLGRVRGFGVQPVRDDTIVTWQNGSGAFVFPNAILPPDDPELADRIVGVLYSVWLTGLRTDVPQVSEPSSSSLDAEFAPYAAVEAIIVDAVPAGTPVSRARAGGDLGWRVGYGWLSVEGLDLSRPDRIRDFARSLAEIPGEPGEKTRAGDPELVAKTLAAGRSM